jgi:hypothetical protein
MTPSQAVISEGCTDANPTLDQQACIESRQIFKRNESTTWSTEQLANEGLFGLATVEESKLDLTGNAYYGFDSVDLGIDGSGLPTIPNQLVAGIATNDFWLGSLGLSPNPFNITTLNNPIPSVLGNLRNASKTPSLSWAYTAGASYKEPPAFGSLVLGGFDTSRFDDKKRVADIPFGADFSRDLVVELQSITYDTIGASPLLANSVNIFIDSMVSHLWLPLAACQAFEAAFDLTWNDTAKLYTVNDTLHESLVAQNPTFTFTIGGSRSKPDEKVDIVFPYAAFDLSVTAPFVDSGSSRYFPLKRANDSSQYTLGRAFLQEAYIVADYERRNFSIAQATFPDSGTPAKLEAILPEGFTVEEDKGGSSLPVAAIAGIAVGAVLLIALVAFFLLFRRRRRRNRRAEATMPFQPMYGVNNQYPPDEKKDFVSATAAEQQPLQGELDGTDTHRYELDPGTGLKVEELSAEVNRFEIGEGKSKDGIHEIAAGDRKREVYEMAEVRKEKPEIFEMEGSFGPEIPKALKPGRSHPTVLKPGSGVGGLQRSDL